jgi:tetratricopeptide (TPR) repeat protein
LDWAGAEFAIDKALMLEPNNSFILGTAASLAGNLGQFEKSIELFERNVKLDPLGLSGLRALGLRYGLVGRFDDGLEKFNQVLAINPDFPGMHLIIGANYLLNDDPETALLEIEKNSSAPVYLFYRVRVLTTLGNEAEAQAIIDKLLKKTALEFPNYMAATYAWRGENDLAFEWYEKTFQQQRGTLAYFLGTVWANGLKTDPRYPAFVEKLGLLEYWKKMPKADQNLSP